MDWFADPPDPFAGRGAVLEDAACRAALRVAGLSAAAVNRYFGRPPSNRLAFAHLVEAVAFPAAPAVSDVPPDAPGVLLTRLRRSRLWGAWAGAWDDRPHVPEGQRVLVARGTGYGMICLYDGPLPDRPHLRVGPEGGRPLVLEPLVAWVLGLDWAAARGG